jgi:hypothetical protein
VARAAGAPTALAEAAVVASRISTVACASAAALLTAIKRPPQPKEVKIMGQQQEMVAGSALRCILLALLVAALMAAMLAVSTTSSAR